MSVNTFRFFGVALPITEPARHQYVLSHHLDSFKTKEWIYKLSKVPEWATIRGSTSKVKCLRRNDRLLDPSKGKHRLIQSKDDSNSMHLVVQTLSRSSV